VSTVARDPLPLRILLVEDDEGDAVLVEELLGEWDRSVELARARSLAEARSMPLAQIDCALLDLNLPDATGFDALRALRAVPDAPAILVLTGFDDEQRGIEAVAAGAQDYLVKGQVEAALLTRSIRYAVERRRAEQNEQQLQLARLHARENARLERGLLPAPLVKDPAIELVSHYRPGRRRALLGGDFYDAVEDADGAVHAVIGDVCGHGPDEAALGVSLRIAWRTLVLGGREPDELLSTLQDVLIAERHDTSVFTTLCMLTIAPDRRSATSTSWSRARTSSAGTPASTSVRQAIRRRTPSAASSGPWPLTSPITACTVPSGRWTASKKSPPSSARRRPGR